MFVRRKLEVGGCGGGELGAMHARGTRGENLVARRHLWAAVAFGPRFAWAPIRRLAIGLGGVFIHLRAELNFYRLFAEALQGFSVEDVSDRQARALTKAGLGVAAA